MELSGLYWRASALRADSCPPGLLSLSNGRLSFVTADARLFDVDAAAVTGRLSGWGSLTLDVDGRRWVLVDGVGQFGRAFSRTQTGAIAAARRAGALRTLEEWPEVLRRAGADVSASSVRWRRWVLGGVLGVLVVAAVVGIVLSRL